MSNTAEVILDTPIDRGTSTISQITLHKPNAGALKGVSYRAVLDMEDDTIRRLVQRIADPKLTAQEVNALEPADVLKAGASIASFFLSKAVLAEVEESTNPAPQLN